MSANGEPTWSEAEWEAAVADLATKAARALLFFVGAVSRAQNAARAAEAAGVTGALRLLPAAVAELDPNAPGFLERVQEPVLRGLLTPEEANKLLDWKGSV